MLFHSGPFMQKGRGFGGINLNHSQKGEGVGSVLSGIFSKVWPVLKKIGKSILSSNVVKSLANELGDEAQEFGGNFISDVIGGKNVKESLESNFDVAKEKVGETLSKSFKKVFNDEEPVKKQLTPKKKKTTKRTKSAKPKIKIKSKKIKISSDIFNE